MFKLIVGLALVALAYGAAVPVVYYAAAPAGLQTVYKTPAKDAAHVAVSNANGNYAYSISEHKVPSQTYVASAPAVHYVAPAHASYVPYVYYG